MDEAAERELGRYIVKQITWDKLPSQTKTLVENSKAKWKQYVIRYSIKNQLRWKTNLIRNLVNDERNYYQEIVRISRLNYMLYPYHISDVLVKGLRITPYKYYLEMMLEVMSSEKSYDALPNFTAADCVRVLGIGRNQFIDTMNRCRAKGWLWKKKANVIRGLLPQRSQENEGEYWWILHLGFVSEEDVKNSSELEHQTIDLLIDKGSRQAGELDKETVKSLITRGLVYQDVPINDQDQIVVPPLEGFVMNRVLGDYFENLLYKIFVSIDERTTVQQLAEVLQVDVDSVKQAVSMYCRLGFAKKKNLESLSEPSDGSPCKWHASWLRAAGVSVSNVNNPATTTTTITTISSPLNSSLSDGLIISPENLVDEETSSSAHEDLIGKTETVNKRIAFLFDSLLTAFLMMGNLGPGLKTHAVTMFEVGKLADEALDDFLGELAKVSLDEVGEGEAKRYAEHAITLGYTLNFLRKNPTLEVPDSDGGLDLLRCERLNSLDDATKLRILQKNYSLLISMAPISAESTPVVSCNPPHFGPILAEFNSAWFKLFIYHIAESGPCSVLYPKGSRLRKVPNQFSSCDRVSLASWDHDSHVVSVNQLLPTLNDALLSSPVLVQAYSYSPTSNLFSSIIIATNNNNNNNNNNNSSSNSSGNANTTSSSKGRTLHQGSSKPLGPQTIDVAFPLDIITPEEQSKVIIEYTEENMHLHPTVQKLQRLLGLDSMCGFIRMIYIENSNNLSHNTTQKTNTTTTTSITSTTSTSTNTNAHTLYGGWVPLEMHFGIPIFNVKLNKSICEKILKYQLFSEQALYKFSKRSRILAVQLLDFIAVHQNNTNTYYFNNNNNNNTNNTNTNNTNNNNPDVESTLQENAPELSWVGDSLPLPCSEICFSA